MTLTVDELLALSIDQPDLIQREICRTSFYEFVKEFWGSIIDAEPVWNWHIKYLCDELQTVTLRVIAGEPKEYDVIINISPGSTKSTIVSQMLNAWAWTNAPWLRFIAGSYSNPLSLEHAEYTRDIVMSDKYRRWYPEVDLRDDKYLKSNYKNTAGGQRFSTSVGGTVTGVHAHIIVVDDPLNPKEAASDLERNAANTWMDKTLSSRKVDKEVTVTILVMQRLHQDDCTGHLLEKDGKRVKHICLPADCTEFEVKPKELEKFYKDGLMDPIRLSKPVLAEAKLDLGSVEYGGQYGQNPMSREGAMFPREKWVIVESAPVGGFTVRSWDLAATDDDPNAAYTACTKLRLVNNSFYIEHVHRFKGSPSKVENTMLAVAKADGIGTIIDFPQDPGQAGKAQAQSLIKLLAGYIARSSTESGSKVTRAAAMSAQQDIGNVFLVRGKWNNDFMDEAEMFPLGKYKDQIDAASRGFHCLLKMKSGDIGEIGAALCVDVTPPTEAEKLRTPYNGVLLCGLPMQ